MHTQPPDWMPHWTQSIRFRLSLTFAATVFAVGSVLLGGMYAWQVHQLNQPVMVEVTQLTFLYNGIPGPTRYVSDSDEWVRAAADEVERRTDLATLYELRKASLVGLSILVVVAFVSGYILSGLALRPINDMTRVARDITGRNLSGRISLGGPEDELKRLSDTFDAMLDRLQAAFEDQRRFIQDTSHELRNPLASARTNLELALSDPEASAGDLRSAAEVAHRSTERMSSMIDDLLEQARTGVPEVEVTRVDMADVAAAAAADFEAASRKRGLDLVVASVPVDGTERGGGGLQVKGDREALLRAASNLVSNAVRLSPSKSEIRIEVVHDDGEVVLSVLDRGPGLSVEDQAQVFRRFWRGENAGAGTGLGLSIVKQIAERHGGRATVTSQLGIGSRFSLSLPACIESRTRAPSPVDQDRPAARLS